MIKRRSAFLRTLGLVQLISLLVTTLSVDAAIRIKAGSPGSALEKYVISDAASLMSKMFNDAIDTSGSGSSFEIVIGTPQNNSLIAQQITASALALPTGKYASLGYTVKTIGSTIYVASATDSGVVRGVYELLEQYGAYFMISKEVLPAKSDFAIKTINKSIAPAFRFVGMLPWDNFLEGMSGWNEEDFRLFIDRMLRMKFNFFAIHIYPGFAYYNEVYSDGSAAVSTRTADFGYSSVVTSEQIGSSAFGSLATFGTRQWWQNKSKGAKVQTDSCQAMMRRVIDYAHARGMTTVIGYNFMGPVGTATTTWDMATGRTSPEINPLSTKNIDLQVERYRRLVQIYPNTDYYWFWQTEARGEMWNTITGDPAGTAMRQQYAAWDPTNTYGGDIDYGYMFMQMVKKLTSAERSKIATGGWGVSDIFNGFNADCPSEIIFHSMNSWNLSRGIIDATDDFKAGLTGRRCWMTDWWEYDGLAWFAEYRVRGQEKIYKAAVANNVEGLFLDGWKQSGVEHQFRYVADFAWNPTLTGAQFYSAYSAKLYGAQGQATLAKFYMENDSLEPTIPGGTSRDARYMCLGRGWAHLEFSPYAATTAELDQATWTKTYSTSLKLMQDQILLMHRDSSYLATLKGLRPSLDANGQYWLDLMINRIEFRILLTKGLVEVNRSYVTFNTVGKASGIAAAKTAAIADLNASLPPTRDAILKLAELALNTSDLGTICQLNNQHYNKITKFITDNGGTVGIVSRPNSAPSLITPLVERITSVYSLDGRLIVRHKGIVPPALLRTKGVRSFIVMVREPDGRVTLSKKITVR